MRSESRGLGCARMLRRWISGISVGYGVSASGEVERRVGNLTRDGGITGAGESEE